MGRKRRRTKKKKAASSTAKMQARAALQDPKLEPAKAKTSEEDAHHRRRSLRQESRSTKSSPLLDVAGGNYFYNLLISSQKSGWQCWLIATALLFVFPLVANVLNGTALDLRPSLDWPWPTSTVATFLSRELAQPSAKSISFCNDYAMLIFCGVLYPIQTAITVFLWRRFPRTFRGLVEDRLFPLNPHEHRQVVKKYNRFFRSQAINIAAALLAIATTAHLLREAQVGVRWWGSPEGGPVGLLSFCWISFLVWYQISLFIIKGFVMLMLARQTLLDQRFCAIPFHSDGNYGLGSVARLLFIAFLSATVSFLGTITLLYSDLVSSQTDIVLLVVILIVIQFFPIFELWPLAKLHTVVQKMKTRLLEEIEKKACHRTKDISELETLLRARREVCRMSEQPLQGPTLIITSVLYLMQILGATAAIYSVFSRG